MGTNSLPASAPRRRSLNLPSFRRSTSAAERQEVLKNADELMIRSNSVQEAAGVQRAAAWQWFTRGAGEVVLLARPTRPPVRNWPKASVSEDKSCVGAASRPISNARNSSMSQEKTVKPPPLAESHGAASRFKVEARLSFAEPARASEGGPPSVPTLPAAPSGGPFTPALYDELELSSLCTHLADFVQRLQHQDNPDQEALPLASARDHQQLTSLSSSPAPVTSSFHIKPFSALQKLLRKVLSGSVPKCAKNFPPIIDGVYEPAEVPYIGVHRPSEYHHHHYIHHHHHHYRFSKSPEEQASSILSRRRLSESGSSRPCTPTLVEVGSEEESEDEDEVEERQIAAYLERRIRRRRHSDSFSTYQLLPENAGFDKDIKGVKEESAHLESPMQVPRRYTSERFLASRVPTMADAKDKTAQPVEDECDEGAFAGIRSRRRHSAQLHREQPSLEETGGKSLRGAYVLGGAGASGGTPASTSVVRRRHSESSKERPEEGAKQTPSPGRPYWISPSARYYVDVQKRHMATNAATTGGLHAGLPPLYPQ